jgi:hypothetical protein
MLLLSPRTKVRVKQATQGASSRQFLFNEQQPSVEWKSRKFSILQAGEQSCFPHLGRFCSLNQLVRDSG